MDDSRNWGSTANELLDRYGLRFGRASQKESDLTLQSNGLSYGPGRRYRAVTGGTTWLIDSEGESLMASVEVGSGLLVACGTGEALADDALGFYKSIPEGPERQKVDLSFALIDQMLGRSR